MNKSEAIISWIRSHKMFSYNAMCKEIGINTGNFFRSLTTGKIPEKHIPAIENIIKEYGYDSKSYQNLTSESYQK